MKDLHLLLILEMVLEDRPVDYKTLFESHMRFIKQCHFSFRYDNSLLETFASILLEKI